MRHRLAESLVAVEAAAAALDAAWLDGSPLAAALAKAIAGRNGRTVARHAQQVLAGIGFTTEHDLHQHLRRTYALDGLLGDARSLTIELGEQLLAARQVPARSCPSRPHRSGGAPGWEHRRGSVSNERAQRGRPRTCSATMLRWIWEVPPAMVPAKLRR